MNEQAQKVLIDLLNRAVSGIDKAVEFSQAQIPDVIHQLLVWNAALSAVWFLFWVTCAIFCAYLAKIHPSRMAALESRMRDAKKAAREAYDKGEAWTRYNGGGVTSTEYDRVMGMRKENNPLQSRVVPVFLSFLFVLFSIGSTAWLKILIAPKLYLIEYAATLIK